MVEMKDQMRPGVLDEEFLKRLYEKMNAIAFAIDDNDNDDNDIESDSDAKGCPLTFEEHLKYRKNILDETFMSLGNREIGAMIQIKLDTLIELVQTFNKTILSN